MPRHPSMITDNHVNGRVVLYDLSRNGSRLYLCFSIIRRREHCN